MTCLLSATIWIILAAIAIPKVIDATGECSNPAPGTPRMARGVDITRLDLLPLDVHGPNGFKSPVVNFTCHEGKTWTSLRGGDVYQLPDQIWHINSLPGGWLHADTKIYRSYQDVRHQMNRNVGAEGSFWKIFSFSRSSSYSKMQSDIMNSSKTIADVGAFDSATQADFVPGWRLQLDMFTKEYVDLILPESFESNPSAYNDFIKMFGTHYFATAKYGGFIRLFQEILSSYARSATNTNIESQAKASFFSILSLQGSSASTSTKVNEQYRQATTVATLYYGGHTNLLDKDGIQQWQPTVSKNPWLFSGTLQPISDLIRDPSKKNSMIKAVTTYILKSYLDELDRLLATVTGKGLFIRIKKSTLMSKVTKLRGQVIISVKEVTKIDEEVQNLISSIPLPTPSPTPRPTPRPAVCIRRRRGRCRKWRG